MLVSEQRGYDNRASCPVSKVTSHWQTGDNFSLLQVFEVQRVFMTLIQLNT